MSTSQDKIFNYFRITNLYRICVRYVFVKMICKQKWYRSTSEIPDLCLDNVFGINWSSFCFVRVSIIWHQISHRKYMLSWFINI